MRAHPRVPERLVPAQVQAEDQCAVLSLAEVIVAEVRKLKVDAEFVASKVERVRERRPHPLTGARPASSR